MESSSGIYATQLSGQKNKKKEESKSPKNKEENELTLNRIEQNVSYVIDDEEEKEPKRLLQRYNFESSKALMLTAKEGMFHNVKELCERLAQAAGAIQHLDLTHVQKGIIVVEFEALEASEKAYRFCLQHLALNISADKVNHSYEKPSYNIPKIASAPPAASYYYSMQNKLETESERNRYHQALIQQRAYPLVTPSTQHSDSSREESTRLDTNNSYHYNMLNNSAGQGQNFMMQEAVGADYYMTPRQDNYVYWGAPMSGHNSFSGQPGENSLNNTMWTGMRTRSWFSVGDDKLEETWPGHPMLNTWTPLNASALPFQSTQGSTHSSFLPQLSPLQPLQEEPTTPVKKQQNSPGTVWGKLEVSPEQAQKKLKFIKKKKKKELSSTMQDTTIESKEGETSQCLEPEQMKQGQEAERKESLKEEQFLLEIDKIASGEDLRTTLMIRNIPNKYDQKLILKTLEPDFKNKYDFFYLPIDFKNKCNVGYAFINFINPQDIPKFYEQFHQQRWAHYNSEKICDIRYARIQGCGALKDHFKSSSVMQQADRGVRPLFGLAHKKKRPPRYYKRTLSERGY